jgi:hypothetical protein
VNLYGDSEQSIAGNGAVIQLVPDAPINLVNDYLTTTDVLIQFFWDAGLSDGGSPVIDYSVWFDQGSQVGVYVLLQENRLATNYYTTGNISPGETYTFKVTARNLVGTSDFSTPLSIFAAKPPDAPINVSNVAGITTAY